MPETCPDESKLHIVPGNHDVDWRGSMRYADLSVDRLSPIVEIIDASRLAAPLTVTTRTSTVQNGTASLSISSVNTCRASGAYRQRPEFRIADPLVKAVADATGLDEEDIRQRVTSRFESNPPERHEELDIPLVEGTDLQSLISTIGGSPKSTLHVVAAHHGFLPQVTARINPYSEMVNGGDVRQALLAAGRPVVYIHGHVHDDRVEIITAGKGSTPANVGSPLVVISAPPLVEGYNELEFEFSGLGTPLGLTIKRYRIAGGVIYQMSDERVALCSRAAIDPRAKYLVQRLHTISMARGTDILRWRDGNGAPEETKELDDSSLEECIEQLCWQGVVDSESSRDIAFADREYRFR